MSGFGIFRRWRLGASGLALVLAAFMGGASPLYAGEGEKSRCDGKLEDCLEYLANKMKSSGWVGVELEIDEEKGTHTVLKVLEESPAEAAGIQVGDRLVTVNGSPIAEFRKGMLSGKCDSWKPGQSVTYTIKRGEVDRTIRLILAPMPAEVLARYIGEHIQMHAGESEKDGD
ncbi:MAG TPA: PDZ domain-containing protein [Candidatus Polarisedimenticolia bacterium]|nr:PDZ domain-containing protein [Candidatus Polarisedimenticolia bacterium]